MTFQEFKEEFAQMILDSKNISELTQNLLKLQEGLERLVQKLKEELGEG